MKILLIDDNKSITKTISKYLTVKGYQCTVSNSGKEGLKLIKTENFDTIVLDLAMPEFTGFDVLESLEDDGILKKQKIVILTAAEISEDDIEKMGIKGIKVLKKPIQLGVLEQNLTT